MRFEPKTEKEVAEAGLLPKGEYDFEVASAEDERSKAGNDMLALILNVYDTDGQCHRVRDWLVSTDGGAYKVRHFAYGVGLGADYEKGVLTAELVTGCTGRCKLLIKKDPKGEYPDKNAVGDYCPPTNGNGAAKPTAPAQSFQRAADLDDEIPF